MAATATNSSVSSTKLETIHIYIDNSNLWIQGQKTYAAKKKLDVSYDPTWRFDAGRLKSILIGKSTLQSHPRNFEVSVDLYGSTPPPVDTVWGALESHGVKVSTFARSTWTGREKQVDMEMGVKSSRQALKDSMNGLQSEFIIVSGDRDLYSAISEIVQDGFPVHVWSWQNCMAEEYRRNKHELIHVYPLDEYLEEIGFHETTFRVDQNRISPHSIVVLDPLSKADEINSFVSRLKVPVHKYECPALRDGASSKDLVIIPSFAHRMDHSALVSLFKESKAKLKAFGLDTMTYFEYRQTFFHDSPKQELAISNQFAELPDPEAGSREGNQGFTGQKDDNPDDATDTNDGFTEVKYLSEQRKQKFRKDEQKLRNHCYWGIYCNKVANCGRGHTKEEEQYLKTYGPKKPRKTALCQKLNCMSGERCNYAHRKEEQRCTACDGIGHGRLECPVWS